MKGTLLTMILLFVAGCARSAYVHAPAADHPANPAAATAPLPPASNVLNTTAPKDTAAAAPAEFDHSAHADHAAPAATQAAAYVCPRHPQVTSNDRKARCTICGMFLKPPKKGAGQ